MFASAPTLRAMLERGIAAARKWEEQGAQIESVSQPESFAGSRRGIPPAQRPLGV
jgi:hypothetical protein